MGHLSPRDLIEGNLEGGLLSLGTLKDILIKAFKMGVCFHTGPTFGEHRDMILYLRFFERRGKILYLRKFL